jgi:hypothetical protein
MFTPSYAQFNETQLLKTPQKPNLAYIPKSTLHHGSLEFANALSSRIVHRCIRRREGLPFSRLEQRQHFDTRQPPRSISRNRYTNRISFLMQGRAARMSCVGSCSLRRSACWAPRLFRGDQFRRELFDFSEKRWIPVPALATLLIPHHRLKR